MVYFSHTNFTNCPKLREAINNIKRWTALVLIELNLVDIGFLLYYSIAFLY